MTGTRWSTPPPPRCSCSAVASCGPSCGAAGAAPHAAIREAPGRAVRCLLLAAVLLSAAAAQAQNLVMNPDFADGIAGWHLVGRGAAARDADGVAGPGSLQVTGGLAGDATQSAMGQCVTEFQPAQPLHFEARVRVVTGTPDFCRIALYESEGVSCRWIRRAAEVRRSTFSGGWDAMTGGSVTTSPAARSIELRLHCANPEGDHQPLEVRFDDVSVTPGSADEIFSDGFELADTTRWSHTSP